LYDILSTRIKNSESLNSVADPHHLDADPDPACHFDADPDPDTTFYFDASK
jgi:hypothetical protein